MMKYTIKQKMNKNNSIKKLPKTGFTLVELMISIGVITILAGMAAQTFSVVLTTREEALKRIEMSETGRSALDYIASDLRTAYLTPDSVKPVAGANLQEAQPRFRFAGIHRDVVVEPNSGVPGAGVDDDGDGLIDEEILDGIDADYSGGAKNGLSGGRPVPDPQNCPPDNNEACIDEDIGVFPSDILHFVSAVETSGDIILSEISYGLDPTGTRLIRRAQVVNLNGNSSRAVQDLMNFGQFIDDTTNKRLLPPSVPPGAVVSQGMVNEAMNNWDDGARYGQLQSQSGNFTNKNPQKTFQVLAYDVRGLRFRYWYYDYNRGGWRVSEEWDSSRETALMNPAQNLFNQPAANNSIEGRGRRGFENIIVNEPDDMYPRVPGDPNRFLITNPSQLVNSRDYTEVAERIVRRTDGLPNMVEIIIYVQDRSRSVNPKPFTSRVFVPNNYRSLGV